MAHLSLTIAPGSRTRDWWSGSSVPERNPRNHPRGGSGKCGHPTLDLAVSQRFLLMCYVMIVMCSAKPTIIQNQSMPASRMIFSVLKLILYDTLLLSYLKIPAKMGSSNTNHIRLPRPTTVPSFRSLVASWYNFPLTQWIDG